MTQDIRPIQSEPFRHGDADYEITEYPGYWLVSRYPIDKATAGWPGYTFSSTIGECPAGPDVATLKEWIMQRWPGGEPNADALPVTRP